MANELDPRTRKEVFLAGMLYGDPDDLPDPETRDELYMKAIGEAIKAGGLPDPSEASEGDVLAIGSDGPEWVSPSGGTELWQHIAYIVISNSPVSDLNGKSLQCVFLSGSEEFALATGPRQWALDVCAPPGIGLDGIAILNQATGDLLVRYGSTGFTAKTVSSTDPTYTVSYGNHLRII